MKAAHRVLDPGQPSQIPRGLCALGVMTKAPRAGKVKTRLTPPLTSEEAAQLNIRFLRDTAAAILQATNESRSRGIAVYTPVGEEAAYADLLPHEFDIVPQRGEAFGERLIFATEDLLQLGFSSVCLIDSDSPTVPASAFSEAANILAQPEDSIVIGPSDDGGYYLIGLKKMHRPVFEDITWSTEYVMEETMARARDIGVKVHLLPACFDVDDRVTLARLCSELFGGAGSSASSTAPSTREYLEQIMESEGRSRIWPNEL